MVRLVTVVVIVTLAAGVRAPAPAATGQRKARTATYEVNASKGSIGIAHLSGGEYGPGSFSIGHGGYSAGSGDAGHGGNHGTNSYGGQGGDSGHTSYGS